MARLACAHCGQPLDDDERFCGYCGNPALPAPESPPAPGGRTEIHPPAFASTALPDSQGQAAAPRKRASWLLRAGGALGLTLMCVVCFGAVVLLPFFFPDLLDRIPLPGTPVAGIGPRSTATPSPTTTPILIPTVVPSTTPTLTPEATPTSTLTAIPPTPTQTPTETPSFTLLVQDGFDSNENGWVVDSISCQWGSVKRALVGGRYRWDVRASQGVVWQSIPRIGPVSDFAMTVDGQGQSGPTDEAYGMTFRGDGDNYYLFEVSDAGAYRISLLFNDAWRILTDWTASAAIQPGAANRLGVLAEGPNFVFFINDEYVGEAADPTLASGRVGLAVVMFGAGEEATFEFDNFELYAPKASSASPHTLVLAADRRRPGGEDHPCPSVEGSRGIAPPK